MEVDHIFICVQSGAPEAETLKKIRSNRRFIQ